MKKSLILSLATYSKRYSKLIQVIPFILNQTEKFDKLVLNVQDDLTETEFVKYRNLEKYDARISVSFRPSKWRSFNKFIHVVEEFPDSDIVTLDDDIRYPKWMVEKLVAEHNKNPNCIIAHELNPVDIDRSTKELHNIMSSDVKLLQKGYAKYLTGCCLIPSHTFTHETIESMKDYDEFYRITQGTHDELWMWIHSTILGIKVIGLNSTWTFDIDGAFPSDENSLCRKNGNPHEIESYDKRIMESKFGKGLYSILESTPVEFSVTPSNLLAVTGNMAIINSLYRNFKIVFDCTDEYMLPSALRYLVSSVNRFSWIRNITFKTNICGNFGNNVKE